MFIEIPTTKHSIANRKLVYGVGINDADYQVKPTVNGKKIRCQFYRKWKGMLKRCYSDNYQIKYPTYKGCAVCEEWLIFSNFKSWMVNQDWKNKDLDKDILITGNKFYSPDTCIFVSHEINMILTDRAAARGKWPIGVCFNKQSNKYQAQCVVGGSKKYLGLFKTPEDASKAYKAFKSKLIRSIAKRQDQPLKSYLIRISGERR